MRPIKRGNCVSANRRERPETTEFTGPSPVLPNER